MSIIVRSSSQVGPTMGSALRKGTLSVPGLSVIGLLDQAYLDLDPLCLFIVLFVDG